MEYLLPFFKKNKTYTRAYVIRPSITTVFNRGSLNSRNVQSALLLWDPCEWLPAPSHCPLLLLSPLLPCPSGVWGGCCMDFLRHTLLYTEMCSMETGGCLSCRDPSIFFTPPRWRLRDTRWGERDRVTGRTLKVEGSGEERTQTGDRTQRGKAGVARHGSGVTPGRSLFLPLKPGGRARLSQKATPHGSCWVPCPNSSPSARSRVTEGQETTPQTNLPKHRGVLPHLHSVPGTQGP